MRDPDLDFATIRQDLRDQIEAPEFATVRSRSRVIRRRRRSAVAGAALAFLAVAGVGGAMTAGLTGGPDPRIVADSPATLPAGSSWHGGPITVHGLDGTVLDLPGDVRDVLFADPVHAYALATRCEGDRCGLALGASSDGGRTWRSWTPPETDVPADEVPRLMAVDPTGLVLIGSTTWFGRYGVSSWTRLDPTTAPAVDHADDGQLGLAAASTDDCAGRPVLVWWTDGSVGRLARQPDLDVCWVAPAPTPDGAWWVGGTAGGAPAVAVTRDGGRSWSTTELGGPTGSWSQVSVRGTDVYAVVLTRRGGSPYPETLTIQAVYRSTGGAAFAPVAPRIGTLIGDVVVLPEGRLLAAGPNWYLTAGAGTELTAVGGSLPRVYQLRATPGGYVALNLFDAGWTAVSQDGLNWQKINVR